MEFKFEEQSGCLRKYSFFVKWEECEGAYNEALSEVAKEVELPGFRKGKAPLELVRAKYKNPIETEFIDHYLPKIANEIVDKENLKVFSNPFVDDVKINVGESFNGNFYFELYPEVPEIKADDIEIKVTKRDITETQIDEINEGYRLSHSKVVTMEDEEIQNGDFASISYSKEGEEGNKTKFIACSDESSNPLERFPVGKKCGESYDFEIDEDLKDISKGKYKVTISNVVRRVLPELDDDLAKLCGFETLDALKENSRARAKIDNEILLKEEKDAKLIDALIEKYDFPIPATLLENQLKKDADEFVKSVESSKINIDLNTFDWDNFFKERKQVVEKRIKGYFLVSKLIEQENIELKDEELNEFLQKIAKRENLKVEKIKEILEKSNQLEEIKFRLKEEKALENFSKNVKIKYVEDTPNNIGGENADTDSR